MKQNLDKNENIQIYLENFDIILKLISIKLYNNFNPAVARVLCEFFESLYNIVDDNDYSMTDIEINIILALLIEKYQINNIEIKNQINYLMKLFIGLFDFNKIVMQILNMTLLSNNKIKACVLEFILDLNENENLNICNKSFIRIFALFLHCNDNEVKIRLFELFRNIYNTIGDELWNLNDVIAPKEKKYLQNNIFKGGHMNNVNINTKNKNEDNEEDENNYSIENDDENINNNNLEGNYSDEENLEYEEEHELKCNIYPQKLNNNNKDNNNFYNNKFEKYEKDNINYNNDILGNNHNYQNIENIDDDNINYNNTDNFSDSNFLK
jgi:hypothetical protein